MHFEIKVSCLPFPLPQSTRFSLFFFFASPSDEPTPPQGHISEADQLPFPTPAVTQMRRLYHCQRRLSALVRPCQSQLNPGHLRQSSHPPDQSFPRERRAARVRERTRTECGGDASSLPVCRGLFFFFTDKLGGFTVSSSTRAREPRL